MDRGIQHEHHAVSDRRANGPADLDVLFGESWFPRSGLVFVRVPADVGVNLVRLVASLPTRQRVRGVHFRRPEVRSSAGVGLHLLARSPEKLRDRDFSHAAQQVPQRAVYVAHESLREAAVPHHSLAEPLAIEGVLADQQWLRDILHFRVRGAVQETVRAPAANPTAPSSVDILVTRCIPKCCSPSKTE